MIVRGGRHNEPWDPCAPGLGQGLAQGQDPRDKGPKRSVLG